MVAPFLRVNIISFMNNAANKALTHTSYAAAIADLGKKREKAGVCRWDAGDGYTSEGYYCPRRKRAVVTLIAPNGVRVPS